MTITLTREEAQQVLDALNRSDYLGWQVNIPITKMLRGKLAQPEPEPVAWMYQDKSTHEVKFQKHMRAFVDHGATYEVPLYTAPPQREWQGLTDEDIKTRWDDHIIPVFNKNGINPFVFARAIEAKLKEKNT